MRISIIKPSRTTVLALLLALGSVGCSSWLHKTKEGEQRRDFTVTPRAYDHLSKAQQALQGKDAKAAYAELLLMRKREERLNDHEKALMWQTFAHVYASLDQLKDAVDCLKRALKLNALPDEATLDLRYNLGQLLLATGDAKSAAKTLLSWLGDVKKPSPEARRVAAVAAAQANMFDASLKQIKLALAEVKEPEESWLQLLASVQLQLKQYEDAAQTLQLLLAREPKKTYWLQLAGVYGQLERDAESLAVMEILNQQGLLETRDEVLRLARLYLQQELPLKSAKFLQTRISQGDLEADPEVLELLANAWLYAREDDAAVQVLRVGAQHSAHGRFEYRQAQLYAEQEKWMDARDALQKALDKGDLRSEGAAYMLLGTVLYNAGRTSEARKAFEHASHTSDRGDDAKVWLSRLQ